MLEWLGSANAQLSLEWCIVEHLAQIDALHTSMWDLHKNLAVRMKKRQQLSKHSQNKATDIVVTRIAIRDFIVMCIARRLNHMIFR